MQEETLACASLIRRLQSLSVDGPGLLQDFPDCTRASEGLGTLKPTPKRENPALPEEASKAETLNPKT